MAVAASGRREVSSVEARSPVIDECVKNIHHNRATGPTRLKSYGPHASKDTNRIHHEQRRARNPLLSVPELGQQAGMNNPSEKRVLAALPATIPVLGWRAVQVGSQWRTAAPPN
jgi:hypothetical protein